ncbi:hypothetical protein COJ46_09745 [Bacillus sp. AFS077874]|nr:hypothetical protein CON00_15855 [Bacillus sp. AFS096315]PFM81192.1 hypothetical protein COJ46_09745 [Bacillus sp. AFS077874]
MIYNVTWLTSQTKQIYQATRTSEVLMAHLEECLTRSNLVEMIGELPVPDKGREYGVLIYYYKAKPKKRLLSAAPRRDHNHIVLFRGILSRKELLDNNFDVGNSTDPQPDVKLHSQEEVNRLVEILHKKISKI